MKTPAAQRDVVAILLGLPTGAAPTGAARLRAMVRSGLVEAQRGPDGRPRLTAQGQMLAWRTLAEGLPPGSVRDAAQAEMLATQRKMIAAATTWSES